MAKQYLKPGMKLTLHGGPATVGLSCSVADISIDWTAAEEYSGDEGIGYVLMEEKITYNVYRDTDGRLFYNDEHAY